MTEPTGRELARREVAPPSVERFTAPETAHTVGLTEERAAGIVRQSSNARSIALAALLFVAIFIPIYWFWELGFPGVPGTSRLQAETRTEYVADVARGEKLFLANCARCHGPNGKGESGPYGYVDDQGRNVLGYSSGGGAPLNDPDKLFGALTKTGGPGPGHLNPTYITSVLTVGGRLVCGDSKSIMPIWSNKNGGPLNYRQIEEIVAFLTAGSDVTWTATVVDPATGVQRTETHRGWRDVNYTRPPDASPVPACWRATPPPGGGGASPSAVPSFQPGTADNPRVIKLDETGQLAITDENGQPVASIAVKKGETARFEVTNTANFSHNFYVGAPADLESNNLAALVGIRDFSSGTQTFTYTFDKAGALGFGCLIPGHYSSMHGTFQVIP